jgi:hypothetical protein
MEALIYLQAGGSSQSSFSNSIISEPPLALCLLAADQ